MKTIIIISGLLLSFIGDSFAQTDSTLRKQQQPRIHGQDSGSWHTPRRNPNDTPPGGTRTYRKNMQPKGINPDSSRTPGTKPVMK